MVQLSDSQWRKIQKASGLPECARKQIDREIEWYNIFQPTKELPRPAETRKKLLRIAKLANNLLTAIIGDDANARAALSGLDQSQRGVAFTTILSGAELDVLQALTTPVPQAGRPTPRHDALQLLCQRCWAVERLRFWAENAARSLPAESKGAHKAAENNKWLVARLDAILVEYTGRHVSRGYKHDDLKRYVELCFKATNAEFGPGSIKEAIEAHVRLNRRRRVAPEL
jgi:hypothetical protein